MYMKKTTFVNRANTNEYIYNATNNISRFATNRRIEQIKKATNGSTNCLLKKRQY